MAILEICANSFESAVNAERGGADRIELCQDLEGGGLTPSAGLIVRVRRTVKLPLFVLVRPRRGDFVYSDDEFAVILEDVWTCRELLLPHRGRGLGGASSSSSSGSGSDGVDGVGVSDGIVTGVLNPDHTVDRSRMKEIVQAARPMPVVFHRAFDDCPDQVRALEDVIETGCVRVLTSGGANGAAEGGLDLARLVDRAGDRIVVMPGHGITAANVQHLREVTGANEYHASAKVTIPNTSRSKFGSSQIRTDVDEVKALVKILR